MTSLKPRRIAAGVLTLIVVSACGRASEPAPQVQPETPPAAMGGSMGMSSGSTNSKGVPMAMSGIWERAGGSLTPIMLTDYGLETSAETGVFDDPNVECRGYSIARSTLSSFGVTKLEVKDDHLLLRYEANAGTRKVYLDAETPSEDSGLNGSSIGRVARGGVVQIVSRDFGPARENAFMAPGVKGSGSVYWMGEDFKLFESYRLIDENTLDFVMVMQDPKILDVPRVIHAQWKKLPDDTPFIQDSCVPAEDPFYEGQ